MKKVACIGSEQFVLGFELSGITNTVITDPARLLDEVYKMKENKEIGIVIIEESLLNALDSHDRSDVEDSVDPVFIPLSTKSNSDNIRKLIVKSIGIDLWKGD